jgi:nucleotide-binding universal stress UspA family protein
MDITEGGSVTSVEHFGPSWSPGPFELGRDGPMMILVGTDSSRTALRAMAYAAGLARRQSSRLVVVYVAAPSAWMGMSPMTTALEPEVHRAITTQLRDTLRANADNLNVPVTFAVRTGDPFTELRRTATEIAADQVVVGASTSAGHRLIGSIATRLVKLGHWPVTVVP